MSDMTNEKMFKVLREEGRQYRQKIKSLQELLDSQVKANCGIAVRLCEVEESRDELLESVKFLVKGFGMPIRYNNIIKRAEDLKEKESK